MRRLTPALAAAVGRGWKLRSASALIISPCTVTKSHGCTRVSRAGDLVRNLPDAASELGNRPEFERDLISQRTNEGHARAMAESTRFGRKPKMTKHQAREALKRVAAGEPIVFDWGLRRPHEGRSARCGHRSNPSPQAFG
jgi:hypothetical protein